VLLGAWIGRDQARNEAELARVIELANTHPGTIEALIIGNETLLRRELPAEALGALLRRAKDATDVPVTYADVWEFWLRNAPLAESADFVTIHILPYWEDHPIAIGRAVDHVRNILAKVYQAFPGKTVMIGEAGWPSTGRSREAAVPSLVNQARFVREFVAFAEEKDLSYNLIEAFDQPWKRGQEGTVGGYWGVYDEARAPKFSFTGRVSNDARWRFHAWLSAAAAAALFGLALVRKAPWGWRGWLVGGVATAIAGVALVEHARFVDDVALDPRAWVVGIGGWILAALTAVAVTLALARRDAGAAPRASLRAVLDRIARPWRANRAGFGLGLLQLVAMTAALALSLALAVDPRYRDFPIAAFVIPAIGFVLLRAAPSQDGVEERWLGRLLALAAIAIGAREGPSNWEALGWCATMLALAWPWSGLARAVDWGQTEPAKGERRA
jgi:glucan 1,3-beta-glucosidase